MLYRHLAAHAAARPDAPALVEGQGTRRRVTTFAELDRRAQAVAQRLHAAGLTPGSRVLVAAGGRSSALYVLVAGLLRAGVAAVVPDVTKGLRGAADAWRRVPAEAVVVPDRLAAWLPSRMAGRCWFGLEALTAPGDADADAAVVGSDVPALITFTSGSTGTARAVVRTHGVLDAQFAAVRALLDAQPGDLDLAMLPVFALASLGAGSTVVLPSQPLRRIARVDAEALAAQLRAEGITRLVASPALLERLVRAVPDALSGLRHLHTGGGPVFPDLLDALAAAAPYAEVAAVYGSTEAEPIASWTRPPGPRAAACVHASGGGLLAGTVVPGTRLALVRPGALPADETLSAVAWAQALAAGLNAVGEIAVAGPQVVPSYLGGEGNAEAKRTVRCGDEAVRWHLTGDLGRVDAAGRLWLLGRRAAWTPGAPYPLAVEAALRRVPGVGRGTLVVLPDGASQRVVVAYEGEATEDAVWAALPPGRVDEVVGLPALPLDRRHDAKVDLPALRRMLRD